MKNPFYKIHINKYLYLIVFCYIFSFSPNDLHAQTVNTSGLVSSINLINNADQNNTGSPGKVCIIGAGTTTAATTINELNGGKSYTFNNPAVYLEVSKDGTGYFKPFTANQNLQAFELGKDIKTFNPMLGKGLNGLNNIFYAGARLYLYYVSPYVMPANFDCSQITFSIAPGNIPTTNSSGQPYPYPVGVLEVTLAPMPGITPNVHTNLDYDYQNVDNIQLLLSSTLQYPSTYGSASFGNVSSAPNNYLTAMNLLTGNTSSPGGKFYPAFISWLQSQAGWANNGPASKFVSLGNTTSADQKQKFQTSSSTAGLNNPFPQINSSKGFILNNVCAQYTDGAYHPQSTTITDVSGSIFKETCSLTTNNFRLGFLDQLNTYYEDDLAGFFSDVQNGLTVWSDAQSGTQLQQVFTGSSSTQTCPYFTVSDNMATLTGTNGYTFNICNIAFSSNPLPTDNTYPSVSQTVTTIPSPCPPNTPCGAKFGNTATVTLSPAQLSYINGILSKLSDKTNGVGWLLSQIDSSWSGQITSPLPASSSLPTQVQVNVIATAAMVQVAPPTSGPLNQTQCISQDTRNGNQSCLPTNPSPNWTFSKVGTTSLSNPSFTGTSQVFQNAGQFAAWVGGDAYPTSVMRNISMAFSRGIYRCNNVSMAKQSPPSECTNVTKGSCTATKCDFNNSGVANTSNAYWSLEKNWYPANGHQDYYSEYVHTVQVYQNGLVSPTYGTPLNSAVQAWAAPPTSGFWATSALSNQGKLMGMAYGFGFDEDPDYISTLPNTPPSRRNTNVVLGPDPSYYAHVPAEFTTPNNLQKVTPTSLSITVAPYW